MCALWIARKRFPKNTPLLASSQCHYCVPKICDMLCIPFIPVDVLEDGSMDMKHLLTHLIKQEYAIVVLTLGTTIKNAYDQIPWFHETLKIQQGWSQAASCTLHIHYDAAFGGAVYPFLKPKWLSYTFDTFNTSLHKFWGSANPCSLFLMDDKIRKEVQGRGYFGKSMVELPHQDFTISCSRNGNTVKEMHRLFINETFVPQHMINLHHCITVRNYLIQQLKKRNITHNVSNHISLSVEIFGLSNRVIPHMKQYGMNIRTRPNTHTFDTHVYICTHVTTELIDEFISAIEY